MAIRPGSFSTREVTQLVPPGTSFKLLNEDPNRIYLAICGSIPSDLLVSTKSDVFNFGGIPVGDLGGFTEIYYSRMGDFVFKSWHGSTSTPGLSVTTFELLQIPGQT